MVSAKEVMDRLGEFLGLFLFFLPFIIRNIGGQNIADQFFSKVVNSLSITKIIQEIVPIFSFILISILLTINFLLLKYSEKLNSHRIYYIRLLSKLMVGYLIGEILLYLLLDSIFYRGYLIGYLFVLIILILIFSSILIHSELLIQDWRNNRETFKMNFQKWYILFKYVILGILILILILPLLSPLLGFLPTPPSTPKPYGDSGPFDVEMLRIEQKVPSNISNYILPDNDNNSWYTYIFIPKIEDNRSIPLAFYLHGFGGTNVEDYDQILEHIASYGMIAIFVQYVSFVDLSGSFTDPAGTNSTSSNAYYIRYLMEWSGILQAVDTLLGRSAFSNSSLESIVGSDFEIDTSRLLISGHSMGAGMVPYIATQALKQGWGSNDLILDMEAPWFTTTHPILEIPYAILPNYTILNIMGNDDDHLASPCIGMLQFEKFYNNINPINSDAFTYLLAHSDRRGYPRLVASHYLPTDPAYDALSQWGFYKRIGAMAFYLTSSGNAEDTGDAREYFTNGERISYMGQWSDGTPVIPLTRSQDPFGIRGGENIAQQFIESHDYGEEVCAI